MSLSVGYLSFICNLNQFYVFLADQLKQRGRFIANLNSQHNFDVAEDSCGNCSKRSHSSLEETSLLPGNSDTVLMPISLLSSEFQLTVNPCNPALSLPEPAPVIASTTVSAGIEVESFPNSQSNFPLAFCALCKRSYSTEDFESEVGLLKHRLLASELEKSRLNEENAKLAAVVKIYSKSIRTKNETISHIHTSATTERAVLETDVETQTEGLAVAVVDELLEVKSELMQKGDAFDEESLTNYSHDDFLEADCNAPTKSPLLFTLINKILSRIDVLKSRQSLTGTSVAKRRSKAQLTTAMIYASFLRYLMGSNFQWSFAWSVAILLRQICKSTICVDIFGKIFPGAPGCDSTLCNRFTQALNFHRTEQSRLGSTIKNKVNVMLNYDNGGKYTQGCSRQSITGLTSNPVVTIQQIHTCFIDSDRIFVQGNPHNSPKSWPEFRHCPLTVLDIKPAEHLILKNYIIHTIKERLDILIDKKYQFGQGLKANTERPVIHVEKDDGLELLRRNCPVCNKEYLLDRQRTCIAILSTHDNIAGVFVQKMCSGVLPRNEDIRAQHYMAMKYRDPAPREFEVDTSQSVCKSNTSDVCDIENPVLPRHYDFVVNTTVRDIHHGNPGKSCVQEAVIKQFKIDSRVIGAEGVENHEENRHFVFACADLGATESHWWKTKDIIYLIPAFHTKLNLMKAAMKIIRKSDNKTSSSLFSLYQYNTRCAQDCLASVGQTKKTEDYIFRVLFPGMWDHIIMQVLDSNSEVFERIFNKNESSNLAGLIYDDILASILYGCETYKNFVSLLLDVLSPMMLMFNAYKLGPKYYEEMAAARKSLLDMCFALGMHEYSIALTFDIILMDYLYVQNPEMLKFLRSFFVYQTKENFNASVAFKGFDEGIEELIKVWKHSITSCTKDGFDMGILMESCADNIRSSVLRILGLSDRDKRERPFVNLDPFVSKTSNFFNFYETGNKLIIGNDFRSFDGSELKRKTKPTHQILIEGRERKNQWLQGFIQSNGIPPQVKKSLLEDEED